MAYTIDLDQETLAGCVLEINGDAVQYLPNTLMFNPGLGSNNPRIVTGGGNTTKKVSSIDTSTLLATFKWDMLPTSGSWALINKIKANGQNNVARLFKNDVSINFQLSFTSFSIDNSPDFNLGSDGVVSLEASATPSF